MLNFVWLYVMVHRKVQADVASSLEKDHRMHTAYCDNLYNEYRCNSTSYTVNISSNIIGITTQLDGQEFMVNMLLRSCTCGHFQKHNIPCGHAMAFIQSLQQRNKHLRIAPSRFFISYYFTTIALLNTYSTNLSPIVLAKVKEQLPSGPILAALLPEDQDTNASYSSGSDTEIDEDAAGGNATPEVSSILVQAPSKERQPHGRPQEKRFEKGKRHRYSNKTKIVTKGKGSQRCRLCGGSSHNMRTCPDKPNNDGYLTGSPEPHLTESSTPAFNFSITGAFTEDDYIPGFTFESSPRVESPPVEEEPDHSAASWWNEYIEYPNEDPPQIPPSLAPNNDNHVVSAFPEDKGLAQRQQVHGMWL